MERLNQNETLRSLVCIRNFDVDVFGVVALDDIACANRDWDRGANRSAGPAGICSAPLSRSGLFLDAGLLGVGRRRRLLLGPGHMGGCASGHAVDSRVLGVLGWLLWLARGLLGATCRLLRRE